MKRLTSLSRIYLKFRYLLIPDGAHGDRKRGKLYEPYLKSFGKNFKVATNAFIYNPNCLSVGDNVYIGFNSYIGQGEVTLEDEVLIGNFVSITASNHLKKNNSFRFGGFESNPIVIGKGTWIAAHSCITAGVKIGKGCLIAAGSIVANSIERDNVLIAGVPAIIKKDI